MRVRGFSGLSWVCIQPCTCTQPSRFLNMSELFIALYGRLIPQFLLEVFWPLSYLHLLLSLPSVAALRNSCLWLFSTNTLWKKLFMGRGSESCLIKTRPLISHWSSRLLPDRSDNDRFLRKELWVGYRHNGGQVMATLTLRVLVFEELGDVDWIYGNLKYAPELDVLFEMQLFFQNKHSSYYCKLLVNFQVL